MSLPSLLSRHGGFLLSVLIHAVVVLFLPAPGPAPDERTEIVMQLQTQPAEPQEKKTREPAVQSPSTPNLAKRPRHQPESLAPRSPEHTRAREEQRPRKRRQPRPRKTPDRSPPRNQTGARNVSPQTETPREHAVNQTERTSSEPHLRTQSASPSNPQTDPRKPLTPTTNTGQPSPSEVKTTRRTAHGETSITPRTRPEPTDEADGSSPNPLQVSSAHSFSEPVRARHQPDRITPSTKPGHRSSTPRRQGTHQTPEITPRLAESPSSPPSVKSVRSTDRSPNDLEGSRPRVRPDTGSNGVESAPLHFTRASGGPSRSPSEKKLLKTPSDGAIEAEPATVVSRESSPNENITPESKTPVIEPSLSSPPPPGHERKTSPSAFQRSVRSRIEESKIYPRSLREDRIEGSVVVQFTIHPEGTVSSVRCTECSPSDRLNRAALEAIRRAAPFPKVPHNRPKTYRIRLKYRLR